jgi:hypothetical protein
MNRKSQQMFEMIAVLFVFMILVAMGLVFYAKFRSSSMENDKSETSMLRAVKASQTILGMPELQCTSNNVVLEGCIDYYKASTFAASSKSYFDALGASSIILTQAYPANPYYTVLYNATPLKWSRKGVINLPVIIYNPMVKSSQSKSFGILVIESYV